MRELIALAVLAAGAGWLLSPWSPLADWSRAQRPVYGGQDITWSPARPRGHKAAGGLWHPAEPGAGRNALITMGWDWISQPPSEQGL